VALTEMMIRMNRILEGLMGCQVEFLPAHALTNEQWDESDLELLRGERALFPRYVRSLGGSAFGFPINLHGAFAGLAVVRDLKPARPRKLLLLAELLTSLLEHGLRQEERRDQLRLIEERLHLLEESSNVIPFRTMRLGRDLQSVNLQAIDFESPAESEPSPIASTPLLIQTKAGFPLHRIAVEIHHLSRRWAFVSSHDLPQDVFSSREGLEQLGSITLFIPDIAQLSTEQQLRVAEYLSVAPTIEMPHLIFGSLSPTDELIASGRLLPHLAALLCCSHLEWTERSPEQMTSDLIKASIHHLLAQTQANPDGHGVSVAPVVPVHFQHLAQLDPDQPTFH
jgi:hypothetical protein